MKKIVLLILGVLLFIPMVFADMGAPYMQFEPYDAVVIKDDVRILEYTFEPDSYAKYPSGEFMVIPKGETIRVYDEEDGFAKIGYNLEKGYLKIEDLKNVYTQCYGYISLDTIETLEKDYKYDAKKWDTTPVEVLSITNQEIRKGPALAYEGTGVHLKQGEIIKIYRSADKKLSWCYIEYNGEKGYINPYDYNVVFKLSETEAKTFMDLAVIDPSTRKVSTIIPAGKTLKIKYADDDPSLFRYIEYNDIKGLVVDDYLLFKKDEPYLISVINNVKLYEDLTSFKEVGTLTRGTSFKGYFVETYFDYSIDDSHEIVAYYENGNTKGWIHSGFVLMDQGQLKDVYEIGGEVKLDSLTKDMQETIEDFCISEPEIVEPAKETVKTNINSTVRRL